MLPTLYHKAKSGDLRQWTVWTEGPVIVTEYGQVHGVMQISRKTAEGKNVGRSNETSPEEQAKLEAKSLWTYKVERKYSETPEGAKESLYLPMLAHDFKPGKVKFPASVQPKLDGCLFRNTLIDTDKGKLTIEEIVENKLPVNVLSLNEQSGIFEYQPVINWFNNGELDYKEWLEIVPVYGKHIKCTSDHKFFTQNGWKKAIDLAPGKDKIQTKTHSDYLNSLIAGTLLGDSMIVIEKRGTGQSYRVVFQHTNKAYFNFKITTLDIKGNVSEIITEYGSQGFRFVSDALTNSNFPIKLWYFTGHSDLCGKRKLVLYKTLKKLLTPEAISLWIGDDGSLSYNNNNRDTPILSISTHGHSKEQIQEFVKYFDIVWNCIPNIYTDKRVNNSKCSGQFLTFDTKDTLFILNKLRNKQCHGAEYKFYFSTNNYINKAKDEFKWIDFKVRRSHRMPKATKYDIEVEKNHNYVANNTVVHNCRALASWDGDEISLTSRGGKPWNIPHIVASLDWLPKDSVLDGELYIHGESCQRITSLTKSADPKGKSFKPESETIEYHIYDIPVSTGFDDLNWENRRKLLKGYERAAWTGGLIKIVPTIDVTSEKEMWDVHDVFVQEGYEGAIIRLHEGKYLWGYRSRELLKVKKFQDSEFLVTDARDGRGKMAGKVVWVCKNNTSEQTFECSMKVSMEEREAMFKNRKSFIGRQLTVRHFDLTDDGLPRFPVGIVFRDKKDLPA